MSQDIEKISTEPDPFAAYCISQAMRVGDLVFTSGQAAIDLQGNLVGVGDFDAQAEQVFANLEAVLAAANSGLERVVKVTIYLTDMGNFPKIVALRERYFREPWPADTIVEVGSLALPELEIEIEAVALVDPPRP
jgi:reactive intermediate/imine deaminase